MARKRRRRKLLPEEELVARLLPGVLAGVVVEQHDDGSENVGCMTYA
jgi:hypothetical protein